MLSRAADRIAARANALGCDLSRRNVVDVSDTGQTGPGTRGAIRATAEQAAEPMLSRVIDRIPAQAITSAAICPAENVVDDSYTGQTSPETTTDPPPASRAWFRRPESPDDRTHSTVEPAAGRETHPLEGGRSHPCPGKPSRHAICPAETSSTTVSRDRPHPTPRPNRHHPPEHRFRSIGPPRARTRCEIKPSHVHGNPCSRRQRPVPARSGPVCPVQTSSTTGSRDRSSALGHDTGGTGWGGVGPM